MTFDYKPTISMRDSNFTANLDHVLDPETLRIVKSIDVDELERAFGERLQDFHPGDYEHDVKGYTQPYWYFKGINDEVAGIGFRYGIPRVVGKNVTPERLIRFVKLVAQKCNCSQSVV